MRKTTSEIMIDLRADKRVVESQLIPDYLVRYLDKLAEEGLLDAITVHPGGVPLRAWQRRQGAVL